MIYCWYRDDYKRALNIMGKAVMVSTAMLLVYCLIELFALCGNVFLANCWKQWIIFYIHNIKIGFYIGHCSQDK